MTKPSFDVSFLGPRPPGATHFRVRLPPYRVDGCTEAHIQWFRFNQEKNEWEFRTADSDGHESWGRATYHFKTFDPGSLLLIQQELKNAKANTD